MQIFLASSAIKASYERLEGMTVAFDVTPTGMTQITYIPRVKDVSSLKPFGASRPRELKIGYILHTRDITNTCIYINRRKWAQEMGTVDVLHRVRYRCVPVKVQLRSNVYYTTVCVCVCVHGFKFYLVLALCPSTCS